MDYALECDGPVAIKYPKGVAYTEMDDRNFKYIMGKAEVINFSSQIGEQKCKTVALLAVGNMVSTAKEVRDKIKDETSYEPELVSVRFINPIDTDRVKDTIKKFDYVEVIEETIKRGSFGEAVAYEIAESDSSCKLLHYCIKSETVQHGSVRKLKELCGLDADSIYKDIMKHLKK